MKFPFFSKKALSSVPVSGGGGWWPWVVKEPFSGAWQQNVEWTRETVLAYHAVFACTTLIASDISKLQVKRVRRDSNGVWASVPLKEYSVLERPNNYQNRIQFFEQWIISKLTRGNAYIWKERSGGKVVRLHVLAPDLVLPVVADNGDVYYQLSQDNLTGVNPNGITVPASEIIHDRFNCLFHPLVGLPPLFACGLAAYQGLKIQENSSIFFGNMSRPSGILTAPGAISDEVAARLKASWEANYTGTGSGKTAVLGDDLKYQAMTMTADESQMVEQLRITAEIVCSTFHVPAYKVIGNAPAYNNIEALEQAYYSQCLQKLIEDIELCLDRGLDVAEGQGIEFDLDGLLRMDSKTQVDTLGAGVTAALYSPNEARMRLNLGPVAGGESPYLQQQNFSLLALSKRDAQADPFGTAPATEAEPVAPVEDEEKSLMKLALMLHKELGGHRAN